MTQTLLSALTTAAVGGPAGRFIEARTEAGIIDAVRSADAAGEPLLIIGGGSNLLVSDDGFPGTVLKIASEGFTVSAEDSCGGVAVVVQAGHNWDALVEHAVRHAWSGLEALSGIPGATGATPVQNVGAYGSDVSQTIAAVRTWDRHRNAVQTFTNSELKFGYRDSILKQTTVNGSPRYVVLTVEFQLPLGRMSAPVRYAELARVAWRRGRPAGLLQRCPARGAAAQGIEGHGVGCGGPGHLLHRLLLHEPDRARRCGRRAA